MGGCIYYILISGKVQGVFFRAFAKEKADLLGIRGTVKNLDNGKAEIYAIGNPNNLDRFVDYLKRGPGDARVFDVLVQQREDKLFSKFEIRE